MGKVIDFETGVDRPCDTEDPTPTEGYALQHMQFDNPNVSEPKSSNPFPSWHFYYGADKKGYLRVNLEHNQMLDIPVNVRQAMRAISDLASFVYVKGGFHDPK